MTRQPYFGRMAAIPAVLALVLAACGDGTASEEPDESVAASVAPADSEAPIDDVNWFARPVPHDGDDWIVAFASHDQNYLYNVSTDRRVPIPDRSDAVATPDPTPGTQHAQQRSPGRHAHDP